MAEELNRRNFIKAAALAAGPAIISARGANDKINVGWIIVSLSIFFLLWFIAALRRTVSVSDRDGILTTIVTIGGSVYAALALVAVALEAAIKTMSDTAAIGMVIQ